MSGMFFTKVFSWLTGVSLVISLVSCRAYHTLSIEVLQPANFQIKQGEKLALLERNIRKENRALDFLKNYPALDREYLYQDYCEGVKYVLENSGYSDSVLCLKEQSTVFWNKSFNPPPCASDSIVDICRKFGVDYVLAVELQYYDYSSQSRDMTDNWFIRLYDKEWGMPVDSAGMTFLIGNHYFEEFADIMESMQYMSWEAGMLSAQRLIPNWQPARRRVYTRGKVLRLGYYYFIKDELEEASGIWEGALQLSPRTAIRAGINLGWMYENSGDFEQAEAVLSMSRTLAEQHGIKGSDINYLKEYLETIRQRKEKVKLLDQQLLPVDDR